MDAIKSFNSVFESFGLPKTAIKPSYGIAEATLFVSNIAPDAEATVRYFDRGQLASGVAVPVSEDAPGAVAQVACGQPASSLWVVMVDPATEIEQPDGRVGEIWLQGDNIGRGYWGLPEATRDVFHAQLRGTLPLNSHADGSDVDGSWLRTGDLGFYLDGELYVTGRLADVITVGGQNHYPQHLETTAADASPLVRRGYVAAFTVPRDGGEQLVIIAERASGTARHDPQPAIESVGALVAERHGVAVADVRLLPAGGIPRTTSGKLARRACRAAYLDGAL